MKNLSKLFTIVFVAVLSICSTNNAALSSPNNFTYAVVDVPQVVASSKQVAALKTEQTAKLKELTQFVKTANEKIQAEKDAKKKAALEKKFNAELEAKKTVTEKNYALKLEAIDKNISAQITQIARTKGFDLVLAKGVVLYSGTGVDITKEVMQAVK